MIMVAMITVPASEIYMNDNVPLTITITDEFSSNALVAITFKLLCVRGPSMSDGRLPLRRLCLAAARL